MTKPKSMQEVFQTSATRLLEQNAKSLSKNGSSCEYFNPNGLSCAVGLLFRDEPKIREAILSRDLNRRSLAQLLLHCREVSSFFDCLGDEYQRTMDMLGNVQHIHDTTPPEVWRDKLYNLGGGYALDVSFLIPQPTAA